MARGSIRFQELNTRIVELDSHLLSFRSHSRASPAFYSAAELDATRAFVVLVHAEIESFCEDIVRNKAISAKSKFDTQGLVRPTLKRIVSYYVGKHAKPWDEVMNPTPTCVTSAIQSYIESIRTNNGIKRANLEKLLFPLGVREAQLDQTWLAKMDSFGTNRGGVAHNSARAINPPDPNTAIADVNLLVAGLLLLDRIVGKLK